jgi:hypothetical protein
MTSFPNLDNEAAIHIDAFISTFVIKDRRARWRSVMAMKPPKWIGASAYDCSEPSASGWNTPILNTICKLGLEIHLDSPAFVFPVGISAGDLPFMGTLSTALLVEDFICECVISIKPGHLAVSYGHSNEFRLCKR